MKRVALWLCQRWCYLVFVVTLRIFKSSPAMRLWVFSSLHAAFPEEYHAPCLADAVRNGAHFDDITPPSRGEMH